MNRNDPPFRAARRAPPPLSIPVPPGPVHRDIVGIRLPTRPPPTAAHPPPTAAQVPFRRPCGFCARVRKLLGIGP